MSVELYIIVMKSSIFYKQGSKSISSCLTNFVSLNTNKYVLRAKMSYNKNYVFYYKLH